MRFKVGDAVYRYGESCKTLDIMLITKISNKEGGYYFRQLTHYGDYPVGRAGFFRFEYVERWYTLMTDEDKGLLL